MKLDEIVLIKSRLDDPGIMGNFLPSKHISNIDSYQLMIASAKDRKDIKKVSIVDNDVEIACIIGYFFKHNKSNKRFFHFQRAWTNPEYRNKGLMLKLKQYIKDNWKISFLSDNQLTYAGLGQLKKLKDKWNVKIYDASTGEVLPWDNDSDYFVHEDDFEAFSKWHDHPITQRGLKYFLISETSQIFDSNIQFNMYGICS